MDAIVVKNLYKKYKNLVAVNGINFTVPQNIIFGLLGPNGAGKTTTLEILEGLRVPTKGEAYVMGIKVKKSNLRKIRKLIGVQLQEAAYFDFLTVKELLNTFAALQNININTGAILENVMLSDRAHSYINNLSGGEKQRFSLALTLMGSPQLVFLDEPTVGLDPQARRKIWKIIKDLKKKKVTVIVTTHYLEEAEKLCDKVAFMKQGKIIKIGDPISLVNSIKSQTTVDILLNKSLTFIKLKSVSKKELITYKTVPDGHLYTIAVKDFNALSVLLQEIRAQKIKILDMQLKNPTLEDVFISLNQDAK